MHLSIQRVELSHNVLTQEFMWEMEGCQHMCKVAFLRIYAITNGRPDWALNRWRISPTVTKGDITLHLTKPLKLAWHLYGDTSLISMKSHYSHSDNPNRHWPYHQQDVSAVQRSVPSKRKIQLASGCTDKCSTRTSICVLEGMLCNLKLSPPHVHTCMHSHTVYLTLHVRCKYGCLLLRTHTYTCTHTVTQLTQQTWSFTFSHTHISLIQP